MPAAIKSLAQQAHGYRRDISTARRSRDWVNLACGLSNLADVQRRRSKVKEAISLVREALAVSRRVKDRQEESHALCVRGLIENTRDRPLQAFKWHMRAINIDSDLGSLLDIAIHINHIAITEHALDMVEDAMSSYRFALRVQRHLRDKEGIADVLGNMASLELDRGRPKTALRLQRKALALHRKHGEPVDVAIDFSVLSDIQYAMGNLRLADQYAHKALALRLRLGNPTGIAESLRDLAYIARDRKDWGLSKRLALRAAAWYKKASLPIDSKNIRRFAETVTPPTP
ncbi:MAG: tetratricopeptide repeat protein [Phycisphaerales bacterium]